MENIFEDETDCKRILREVSLMRKLRHPFLVELVEIIYPLKPATFDTLYVVMEYAESDLKKIIKSGLDIKDYGKYEDNIKFIKQIKEENPRKLAFWTLYKKMIIELEQQENKHDFTIYKNILSK